MFNLEFLKKYPEFTVSKGVPLTLLPPALRPKPLAEIIRDDEELDGKLKAEKKKQPESVEAVVFARSTVEPVVWFEIRVGDVTLPIVDVTPNEYPLVMELIKGCQTAEEQIHDTDTSEKNIVFGILPQALEYLACSRSCTWSADPERTVHLNVRWAENIRVVQNPKIYHTLGFITLILRRWILHTWPEDPQGIWRMYAANKKEASEDALEQFLVQEPLCRAMRIKEDPVSLQELMHLTVFYLDSSTSLIAVDPVSHVPIGLMIGKVDDIEECTDKLHHKTVLKSKRVQTILSLTTFMARTANIHDRYNCKTYFRIFFIAVHKDWQQKGIEKALITGALRMCNVMKIWKVGGNFTMYKDQYYLKQFGAKTELEVYYSEWRTDRGLRIFRGTGKTEPKIAFMSLTVPEFEPSTNDVILSPLTSERARRYIKKRLRVWEDLDIYRACQCGKTPEELIKARKKRKMKVVKRKELGDSEEANEEKPDMETKKK